MTVTTELPREPLTTRVAKKIEAERNKELESRERKSQEAADRAAKAKAKAPA